MPTALVLVQNPVTHDGRVLREAGVLRDLGFEVLIAGVVSREERQTELELNGFRVVRLLGPLGMLKGLLRRSSNGSAARAAGGGGASPESGSHGGRLRRFLVTLAFNAQGIALVWRTSPELVHANDYDTMWIGVAAKLLRRSRVVYDAHELWPDQEADLGWRPWLIACEWVFTRLADATVAANPGIAAVMVKRYRLPAIAVVRNLPEPSESPPAPPEGLRAGAQPLAVYVGAMAASRGLEQAIEALAAVPDVRLRLMGQVDAEFRAELERRASAAGVTDRIEFRPAVAPSDVAPAIAAADMGILLTQPECLNNEMSLPNKLFEYAAANLPIVGSDLPLIGKLIREERLGLAVSPTDTAEIAAAMRRLADPTRNAELRASVRAFAERSTWEQERVLLESVYAGLRTKSSRQ